MILYILLVLMSVLHFVSFSCTGAHATLQWLIVFTGNIDLSLQTVIC